MATRSRRSSAAKAGPLLDAADNIPLYTVGEISLALKRTLEETFAQVRVRGEISGFRRHGSGHLYFKLKDEEAVLEAVCWRGVAGTLKVKPEDGLEIVCRGRISAYAGRSQYQIVVESIELAGEGALLKLLEERKRKLAGEGLFDSARKQPIPYLPEVIGVVTSPTGAVIRDILHRIGERFPRRVLLWPVAVQGVEAARQIAAAIEGFNRLEPEGPVPRPDVLIVARGGGSLEDLWPFNEEIVVRAAAASAIPLISGVGHETDTTLIDFAADLRAPTPTAAAEMAVPVRADLVEAVLSAEGRLVGAINRAIEGWRVELRGLARGLPDPASMLQAAAQTLDDRAERLANAVEVYLERRRAEVIRLGLKLRHPREWLAERASRLESLGRALKTVMEACRKGERDRLKHQATVLENLVFRLARAAGQQIAESRQRLEAKAGLLESTSYVRVLERGFALVNDAFGAPVTSVAETHPGMAIALRFYDGETGATVTGAAPPAGRSPSAGEGPGKPRKARAKGKAKHPVQGELL